MQLGLGIIPLKDYFFPLFLHKIWVFCRGVCTGGTLVASSCHPLSLMILNVYF